MKEQKEKTFRRSYWMIDPNLQSKYFLHLILIAGISSALTGLGFFYFNVFYDSNNLVQSPYWTDKLNSIIFIFALFVLLVVIALSVLLSHRIAGPGYRLCKALEKLAEGDLSSRIALRKNDYFKSLAETFNSTVSELEKSENNRMAKVKFILERIENLKRKMMNEKQPENKDIIESLDNFAMLINDILKTRKGS